MERKKTMYATNLSQRVPPRSKPIIRIAPITATASAMIILINRFFALFTIHLRNANVARAF